MNKLCKRMALKKVLCGWLLKYTHRAFLYKSIWMKMCMDKEPHQKKDEQKKHQRIWDNGNITWMNKKKLSNYFILWAIYTIQILNRKSTLSVCQYINFIAHIHQKKLFFFIKIIGFRYIITRDECDIFLFSIEREKHKIKYTHAERV